MHASCWRDAELVEICTRTSQFLSLTWCLLSMCRHEGTWMCLLTQSWVAAAGVPLKSHHTSDLSHACQTNLQAGGSVHICSSVDHKGAGPPSTVWQFTLWFDEWSSGSKTEPHRYTCSSIPALGDILPLVCLEFQGLLLQNRQMGQLLPVPWCRYRGNHKQ